jgi:hypothetical protein
MSESLGIQLRLWREEQGIDLIAIAAQTKIKVSLLEGLERDDVSQWPAGIFRRAYVRAYAQAIRRDPDLVLRQFLEVHPDPGEVVTTEAIASVLDGGTGKASPPTRLHYLVGSAMDSLSQQWTGRRRTSPPAAKVEPASSAPAEPDYRYDAAAMQPHPPEPDTEEAMPPAEQARAGEPPVVPEPVLAAAPPVTAGSDPLGPTPLDVDFTAVARVCGELARAASAAEVTPLLQQAAEILDAPGLIVWIWDASADGLRPALACGYAERVIAQLPTVERDADNATAAAFRSARTCVIEAGEHTTGALALPLSTATGCAGVLAIELEHGREKEAAVRAAATIFAALLGPLTSVAVAPPRRQRRTLSPTLADEGI